jgi:hypothetical protein
MNDEELKALLEPMVMDFWEDAEFVAKSFTGERKDSAGRRICYSNGKRVPCSSVDKKPSKSEKKPSKTQEKTDVLASAKDILDKSGGKKLTAAQVRELSKHVNNMTLKQLGDFQKQFNLAAKGRIKKDRVDSLLESVKSRTPEKKTPKPNEKKPAKPASKPESTPEAKPDADPESVTTAIDYKQTNPDHPVAKQIREDAENAAIVQKFLGSVSDQKKNTLTGENLDNLKSKVKESYAKYSRSKSKKRQAEIQNEIDGLNKQIDDYYKSLQERDDLVKDSRTKLAEAIGGTAKTTRPEYITRRFGKDDLTKEQSERLSEVHDFIDGTLNFNNVPGIILRHDVDGARSFYYAPDRVINVGAMVEGTMSEMNQQSYAHEYGHFIEYEKKLVEKSREFIDYRIGDERPTSMAEVSGIPEMEGEYGRKDNFDRAFDIVGAYYVGKKNEKSTEVISMGLEKMWSDPVGFAVKDPEYFQFMISVLRSK